MVFCELNELNVYVRYEVELVILCLIIILCLCKILFDWFVYLVSVNIVDIGEVFKRNFIIIFYCYSG